MSQFKTNQSALEIWWLFLNVTLLKMYADNEVN